jgi:hypothetical protein
MLDHDQRVDATEQHGVHVDEAGRDDAAGLGGQELLIEPHRTQAAIPAVGTSSWLNGVAATSDRNIWAAGAFTDSSGGHTLAEQFDGNNWNLIPSPDGGQANELFGAGRAQPPAPGWSAAPTARRSPSTARRSPSTAASQAGGELSPPAVLRSWGASRVGPGQPGDATRGGAIRDR